MSTGSSGIDQRRRLPAAPSHATGREARIAWFKSVVLPHEPPLTRYLRRSGMAESDVEDIVAEALLKAYAVSDWPRITLGRSYLFTVARNLVVDSARRQKVVGFTTFANLDCLDVSEGQSSVEEIVSARDDLQRLQDAVGKLPQRCREVFLLRRIDDLPMRTIADRLGLSVSTVEKHLSKAMRLLTKSMAKG